MRQHDDPRQHRLVSDIKSKALTPPDKGGRGLIAAFSSSILASLAPSSAATSSAVPTTSRPDAGSSRHQPPQESSPLSSHRDEAPDTYTCPQCRRQFDSWASCHAHLTARCVYVCWIF